MTEYEFRVGGMTKEEITAILEKLHAAGREFRGISKFLHGVSKHLGSYPNVRDKIEDAIWMLGLACGELEDVEDEVSPW